MALFALVRKNGQRNNSCLHNHGVRSAWAMNPTLTTVLLAGDEKGQERLGGRHGSEVRCTASLARCSNGLHVPGTYTLHSALHRVVEFLSIDYENRFVGVANADFK